MRTQRITNLKMISHQPRLNPERKKLLVDALRSGDYTQVQGTLGIFYADKTRKHCCLGVGCEVSPFEAEFDADLVEQSSVTIRWEGDTGTWSREIAEWFGSYTSHTPQQNADGQIIVEDNPLFFEFPERDIVEQGEKRGGNVSFLHYTMCTATYCNDKVGLTFDQIADLFDFWL